MAVKSVHTYNIRNLSSQPVDTDAREVFLVGENGQGKTNFIECVYLLCVGSSFRTRQLGRLIFHGATRASVRGIVSNRVVSVQVGREGYKQIEVDDERVKDRRQLLETIPCVIFSHDDMHYVTGSPENRRRFIDQTLVYTDEGYIDSFRSYRKVLKARNMALKQQRLELIDVYDSQLARFGTEIQDSRSRAATEFNNTFSPLFERVVQADFGLSIRYDPSWKETAEVGQALRMLQNNRTKDIRAATTTSGPHRDDFVFEMQGKEFRRFASTGQVRLCSLALKAAQAAFILASTGKAPILLLDDVLLEIDTIKRRTFVENLPQFDQVFFTFLPDEDFAAYTSNRSIIYTVRQGEFILWNRSDRS